MWTKYTYAVGASTANVLADVVSILTGTTDKTSLSASCNQASTSILTTYTQAGWTVHDAAAGTNKVCIKAPCFEDAAQFKYVVLDMNTVGYVLLTLYESWNATTHAGVNIAVGSNNTSYNQRVALASGGSLYIYASNRGIVLYGSSAAGNGTSAAGTPSSILECDTGYSWCGAGQGFVPVGFYPNNTYFCMPRHIGKNGGINASSGNGNGLTSPFINGGLPSGDPNSSLGAPMSSGGWATPISPIFADIGVNTNSTLISGFSRVGLLYLPGGALFLDEIPYNSVTYVAVPTSGTSAARFLCPKG